MVIFENQCFILNDNFILTEKGIKFLFNVYEIKPYVVGITNIILTIESIIGVRKRRAVT